MQVSYARGAAALLFGAAIALLQPAAVAAYDLAPGDTLRFTLVGVAEPDYIVAVELDGTVLLPRFGALPAAGRSISALREEVRSRSARLLIKRINAAGETALIEIDPGDILLTVESWRPVAVFGDVNIPGQLPFRVGMTVRSVLALAGGERDLLSAGGVQPTQILRFQQEYETAVFDNAHAAADLWRIEAQITGVVPEVSPPLPVNAPIAQSTWNELIVEARRLALLDLQTTDDNRRFNRVGVERAKARLDALRRQRGNQLDAVENDDESESRIRDLVDRGLAPITRLTDVRRIAVLSSARLLQFEQDIAQAEFELARLERDKQSFDRDRLNTLLEKRTVAQREADFARLRMNSLSIIVSSATALVEGDDEATTVQTALQAVVYRGAGESAKALLVSLDAPVVPGDVIEFTRIRPSNP